MDSSSIFRLYKRLRQTPFPPSGTGFGHLLSGELHLTINSTGFTLNPGELIYLTTETPSQWVNSGIETARLMRVNIK